MSMTVTIRSSGRRPGGAFRWEEAASAWAGKSAPLAKGMLKAHAPFRTGALRASIADRAEASPGRMMVVLYATAPQARWVLDGTRPHLIVARNARALRWLGPGGMGVRFARSVRHPGTKPNPFPDRALEPIRAVIARLFAESVQEVM